MRHLLRATVLAAVLAITTPVTGASAAPPVATTPQQSASYGAAYLADQITAGGYVEGPGGPDLSTTANAVLALTAAQTGASAANRATDYLAAHVDTFVVASGADQPGPLGLLLLVAHARGRDPHAFGGTGPSHDLVARLIATKQTSGADAGLFGSQYPVYDAVYRQSLGLLGLAANGETDTDAIAWLKTQQCIDGAWMSYHDDPSQPCPAVDRNAFTGRDTNSTAIATEALAALATAPSHDALGWLDAAQNSDAGWGFFAGDGTDANSTALVVQALLARGESPTGASWSKGTANPHTALQSLQLGCDTAAAKRGAFAFLKNQDGSLTANTFATVQAVPALAGKAYPVDGSSVDRPTVRMPCSVATPAPTTTSPAAPSPPVSSSPATVAPSVSAVTSSRAQGRVIPATGGGPGAPWDNAGLTVFGLGLLGYGLLALASSRAAARRH